MNTQPNIKFTLYWIRSHFDPNDKERPEDNYMYYPCVYIIRDPRIEPDAIKDNDMRMYKLEVDVPFNYFVCEILNNTELNRGYYITQRYQGDGFNYERFRCLSPEIFFNYNEHIQIFNEEE